MTDSLVIKPANEASCHELQAVFGTRSTAALSRCLVRAAVEHARSRGARALEGYPMITLPGTLITLDEIHVGSRSIFADAGFTQVSHPTPRRMVMRIDYAAAGRQQA